MFGTTLRFYQHLTRRRRFFSNFAVVVLLLVYPSIYIYRERERMHFALRVPGPQSNVACPINQTIRSDSSSFNNNETGCRGRYHWNGFNFNQINEFCKISFSAENLCLASASSLGTKAIPKHIYIMGERHSGTNLITNLLEINFNTSTHDGFGKHKHVFQDTTGQSIQGIAVLSIRNPFDWVSGMKKRCWFCRSTEWNRMVSSWDIEKFANITWYGNFEGGKSFQNIFAMRYAKFCNHLETSLRADCTLLIRHEDTILPWQQVKLVHEVASVLKWENVSKETYLGNYKAPNGVQFDSQKLISQSYQLTPSNQTIVNILQKHMNLAMEASLGYFAL